MPIKVPYNELPALDSLLTTDLLPALRSPDEEGCVTGQDIVDMVISNLPATDGGTDLSYSGTVTTNGTTPTGTPNHRYSWISNDGMCHLHFIADWPNTGTGITTFTIPLPGDCPTPLVMNGKGGANANISPGFAILSTALTSESTARGLLKVNSANDGYEIEVVASSGSYRIANVFVSYFTAPV